MDFYYANVTRVLWGNCISNEEEEEDKDDFDRFCGLKRASLDLVDALGWISFNLMENKGTIRPRYKEEISGVV